MSDWTRVNTWRKHGKDFVVEVKHHLVPEGGLFGGPNRWCVYGYLYPAHPLFLKIDPRGSHWQDALSDLPLHCGCTLLTPHIKPDGGVGSIQFGADYSHHGDDMYAGLEPETFGRGYDVERDALALFEALASAASPSAIEAQVNEQIRKAGSR